MIRRQWIRTAAALPAASLVSAAGGRAFSLALTPGSIGVSVDRQLELNALAARHGFESVEPRAAELADASPAQFEEILGDLADRKLPWSATGLPVEFRRDEATFREGLAGLPRLAAALRRAGAARLGTWLSPSHDELTYRENFRRHASRLREVAKVLGDHGLRLGLEYVGTQGLLVKGRYPFLHTLAETRELIAEIGTGNVGLVLDTWHWWTANDRVEDLLTLRNEDIVSVDLNDAPAGIAKRDQLDNARELPAATGVIDVAGFVKALVRIGYDGPVRPEPFNQALNQLDNDAACAATIAAMKAAVRQALTVA